MNFVRTRRLRHHPQVRQLVQETRLAKEDIITPLFIYHGKGLKQAVPSMPGCFQYSIDRLGEKLEQLKQLGLYTVLLFGVPAQKDALGTDSFNENGIIQQAIRYIKRYYPEFLIVSDICFCEYTDHGHCGVLGEETGQQDVSNDKTLTHLKKQALSHAQAGVDMVAPSGMIDGAVQAIRHALDQQGFSHLPIMGYSAKFGTHLYGPFREAVESTPRFGDRFSYQADWANGKAILREAFSDIEEGADILMVKPASTYLDIIYRIKERFPYMPLAAYQPSGEYAMIKGAIAQGWVKEQLILEVLTGIKRAGADIIITYFGEDMVRLLNAS
jgi:porphobilinogen synthase